MCSHLANEIEQLDEISRLDAHLQGLGPVPARGPGLVAGAGALYPPAAAWSAPGQGRGQGPGPATNSSPTSLPPPPLSQSKRGGSHQGHQEWSSGYGQGPGSGYGPEQGLGQGQGFGPDLTADASMGQNNNNQNVQALVQQAVNAALDKVTNNSNHNHNNTAILHSSRPFRPSSFVTSPHSCNRSLSPFPPSLSPPFQPSHPS